MPIDEAFIQQKERMDAAEGVPWKPDNADHWHTPANLQKLSTAMATVNGKYQLPGSQSDSPMVDPETHVPNPVRRKVTIFTYDEIYNRANGGEDGKDDEIKKKPCPYDITSCSEPFHVSGHSWKNYKGGFQQCWVDYYASKEQEQNRNFMESVMLASVPVKKIVVFGISMHGEEEEKWQKRWVYAMSIFEFYHRTQGYKEIHVEKEKPWYGGNRAEKFEAMINIEGLELAKDEAFTIKPAIIPLETPDAVLKIDRETMVIILSPDNPIRQVLGELMAQDRKPAAILCCASDFRNKYKDPVTPHFAAPDSGNTDKDLVAPRLLKHDVRG